MKEMIKINSKKYTFGGITLISLVITIVILIILASATIYLSLGNNGILTRVKQAKEINTKQEATEKINLKITTAQMNKYAEKQEMPTLQEFADILYEDREIQYVVLESKVSDKEKITVGDKTSIFTKLNKYPYEFEINSSLQLASINGVEIKTAENNNETNMCNQKLLTTITLPQTRDEIRQAGKYYANTTSFTKENTEKFDKYLIYSDSEGWKVKLSGWYSILTYFVATPQNTGSNVIDIMSYININGTDNLLGFSRGTEKDVPSNCNWFTTYLEKDTKLNFEYNQGSSCKWNGAYYKIYALFD